MADKKISQLTTVIPTGDDFIAVVDNADPTITKKSTLDSIPKVTSVVAGTNITVDNTDPKNPIISATAGGGYMLSSTYDPENGERQVAFKDSVQTALDNKVDKITGKGLSTEDYTASEKSKLAGIEAWAQVNTLNDVVAGTNIVIDKTDPKNPIISSVGAGAGDVTASGTLTDNTIVLGGGTKTVKSSSKTIVTTLGSDDTTVPTSKAVADVTNAKQDLLVSGVNISTINGNSLLVGGDLEISTKKYVDDGLATKVSTSRTLTINGTTYDLTADRSWTISGGGLSWGATITGTSGTGLTATIGDSATAGTVAYSGVISNTQTGASTLISLNSGTSAQPHKLIDLTLSSSSDGARAIKIT